MTGLLAKRRAPRIKESKKPINCRLSEAGTCPTVAPSGEGLNVALSEIDRGLLERCIARKPRAWEDFVDRFMGLMLHVIDHTARSRCIQISPEDREDLCAAIFLEIIKDDFALLRHFRRQSSLATYLTVVARRVVVHALMQRRTAERRVVQQPQPAAISAGADSERQLVERDEIERLLQELDGMEADVVRMFHLEGKSYQEIGSAVGISENSVGPLLSRAREKMRRAAERAS
jgi:RNA polymerase sigma-70 factor (ECF subfamily)